MPLCPAFEDSRTRVPDLQLACWNKRTLRMTLRGCDHPRSELFRHDVSAIRGSPAPDPPKPTTASSECEHSEVCDDQVTMRPEGCTVVSASYAARTPIAAPNPRSRLALLSSCGASPRLRRCRRCRASAPATAAVRLRDRSPSPPMSPPERGRASNVLGDERPDLGHRPRRPPPSILSVGHVRQPPGSPLEVASASAAIGDGPSRRPRMLTSQDSSNRRHSSVATGTRRSLWKADAQAMNDRR